MSFLISIIGHLPIVNIFHYNTKDFAGILFFINNRQHFIGNPHLSQLHAINIEYRCDNWNVYLLERP